MIRRAKQKLISQYDSTVIFFADALVRMRAHEGFKRYFQNTGWLFVGRIGSMVITFLVGVYFARYLGPSQFGLLSYAVSFVGLFAFINSFGIDSILVRELVQNPDKRDELLGSALLLKVIGTIALALLVGTAAVIAKGNATTNILILIITTSYFFQVFNIIDLFFQSQVLSKKMVVAQLLISIVLAFTKLILIHLRASLVFFAFIYILEAVLLAGAFVSIYTAHRLSIFNWKPHFTTMTTMLKSSWLLLFSSATAMIYLKIDQVMVGHMINTDAVGIYAVAVKLSEIWYFVPSIILSSLLPAIINAQKAGKQIYEKRLMYLYALLGWLAIGIALLVSLFSNQIIDTLFGHVYAPAVSVLRVYVWAGVPIFLGMGLGQFLLAENYMIINFFLSLFGAITNIILNIFLIPRYGINGAAIATLISYSVIILSIFLFKKTRAQGFLMIRSLVFTSIK